MYYKTIYETTLFINIKNLFQQMIQLNYLSYILLRTLEKKFFLSAEMFPFSGIDLSFIHFKQGKDKF